jgi:vitamin B12 transporter
MTRQPRSAHELARDLTKDACGTTSRGVKVWAQTAGEHAARWWWALCFWALAAAAGARAQYGAQAHVNAPSAELAAQDPTVSQTVVQTRSNPRALSRTAEFFLDVPGVRLNEYGGWGSPAYVLIRGTDPQQAAVFLDDMPLNPADGGAFDLSSIPPWLIDRIEVYRGTHGPPWYGMTAVGGTVRLVPTEPAHDQARGRVGAGSYGLYLLDVEQSACFGKQRGTCAMATFGTFRNQGDFLFRDGNGTPFDQRDDKLVRRQNNDSGQSYGALRVRSRLGHGVLDSFVLASARDYGEAGPAVQPTTFARRDQLRALGLLTYTVQSQKRDTRGQPMHRYQISGNLGWDRNKLNDPYGEIGLVPIQTNDTSLRTYVRGAGTARVHKMVRLTSSLSASNTYFQPTNALSDIPNQPSNRFSMLGVMQAQYFGQLAHRPFDFRLSGFAEYVHAALSEIRTGRENESTDVTLWLPTWRAAFTHRPWQPLAVTIAASQGQRAPSMVELFGDRGYLQGDTKLKPETNTTAELSAVLRSMHRPSPQGLRLQGQVELRGFVQHLQDLIRYRINAQYTAVPENIAEADIAGAELGVQAHALRQLHLVATATYLYTNDGSGRSLPLRPSWQGYVRPSWTFPWGGARDAGAVYAEVTYIGSNYVNPANLGTLDARTLVGVGATLNMHPLPLELALAARNVFNVYVTDVVGFPLPARTISVSATLHTP